MSVDTPQVQVAVTLAHLHELLDSPAERPVVYRGDAFAVCVGPRAFASMESIIISQEALLDFLQQQDASTAVAWDDPANLELLHDLLEELNSNH